MAKKKHFFLIDSETSINGNIKDFAGLIVDKQGIIYNRLSVWVKDFKDEKLFYNTESGFFGLNNLKKREIKYHDMLHHGEIMIGSISAINKWIAQALETYPGLILAAYNLPFDVTHCKQSGIDFSGFVDGGLCLWKECSLLYSQRRGYRQFCIDNHLFTGRLTMKTSAEAMLKYLHNDPKYQEPHTAMSDLITAELPIFINLMRQKKKIHNIAYNWRHHTLATVATAK